MGLCHIDSRTVPTWPSAKGLVWFRAPAALAQTGYYLAQGSSLSPPLTFEARSFFVWGCIVERLAGSLTSTHQVCPPTKMSSDIVKWPLEGKIIFLWEPLVQRDNRLFCARCQILSLGWKRTTWSRQTRLSSSCLTPNHCLLSSNCSDWLVPMPYFY